MGLEEPEFTDFNKESLCFFFFDGLWLSLLTPFWTPGPERMPGEMRKGKSGMKPQMGQSTKKEKKRKQNVKVSVQAISRGKDLEAKWVKGRRRESSQDLLVAVGCSQKGGKHFPSGCNPPFESR